jgi:hypothetical protein
MPSFRKCITGFQPVNSSPLTGWKPVIQSIPQNYISLREIFFEAYVILEGSIRLTEYEKINQNTIYTNLSRIGEGWLVGFIGGTDNVFRCYYDNFEI